MVAPERRASAYGLFTAAYGVFWFLGSATIGFVYDLSLCATVSLSLAFELAAIPLLWLGWQRSREPNPTQAHTDAASERCPP